MRFLHAAAVATALMVSGPVLAEECAFGEGTEFHFGTAGQLAHNAVVVASKYARKHDVQGYFAQSEIKSEYQKEGPHAGKYLVYLYPKLHTVQGAKATLLVNFDYCNPPDDIDPMGEDYFTLLTVTSYDGKTYEVN